MSDPTQQHYDPKITSDWRSAGQDSRACIQMADTDNPDLFAVRNSRDPNHVIYTPASDFREAAANVNTLLGSGGGRLP